MSKAKTNTLTLVLASIGCFVTLILFYKHVRPAANVGCAIFHSDCGAVIDSSYGHVGPIPTSVFGLGMYLTVFVLCLKRRKLIAEHIQVATDVVEPVTNVTDAEKEQALSELGITPPAQERPSVQSLPPVGNANLRKLDLALWLIALSALGISWWLQYIALFRVFSLCPWCFSSACLVTAIFLVTGYDYLLRDRKLVGEQKLMAGTIAFIGAMGFMMGLPTILNQIGIVIRAQPQEPHPAPPVPAIALLRTKDMEVTGNPNSPITIVEFADYQCEHCRKAGQFMAKYMKENPNRFRFAFRNYPLPMHAWARQAAIAAEAAGEQHKFWEMHDYIFQHQPDMDKKDFSPVYFEQYATDLGLNMKRFEQDVQSEKITNRVDNDINIARPLVTMTPSFFIFNGNGSPWMVTGQEDMQNALDDPDNKVWKPSQK